MAVTVSGTPSGELDKRLYLNGVRLHSTCPACKQDIEHSLKKQPLSNPPMNEPFTFMFYHGECPANEYGTEWAECLVLKLSVEPGGTCG